MPCCKAKKFGSWCEDEGLFEYDGKHYCVFHLPSESHDKPEPKEFNSLVFDLIDQAKENHGLCNLSGVHFPGNISFCAYGTDNPLPEISFYKTTFSAEANFKKSAFSEKAEFRKAIFRGKAVFYKAIFGRMAIFQKAVFNGKAIFQEATFYSVTYFHSASFNDMADFRNTQFKSITSFLDIQAKKNFSLTTPDQTMK